VLASDSRSIKISRSMQGNTNSQPARIVSEVMRRIAVQEPHKLRKVCEAMYRKAAKGDSNAFTVIADRIEGKVALQIQSSSTLTIIDADLLREAGYLLTQIGATLPPPVDIVDPEPSQEVISGHEKAIKRHEAYRRRRDRQIKTDAGP